MEDIRFSEALYTIGEAANMLRVPPSTFATWAKGYTRTAPNGHVTSAGPIISSIPDERRGWPEVPFVGLVEGMVATAFRAAGVSMQHIRRALPILDEQMGIEHALASRGLRTDGARVLFDYAVTDPELESELAVVLTQQRVFSEVVERYLARIEFSASDQWATRLVLPLATDRYIVEANPRIEAGRPRFIQGGAPVEHVIARFQAGDTMSEVAHDFGVPIDDLEDVIRATLPAAA